MKVYNGNFLKDVVAKLLEDGYRVYAPVREKDYHVFRVVESVDEVSFDYVNTKKSPKDVTFPQNEVLIKYGDWVEEIPARVDKTAIVGIRPCDIQGLKLMDSVFLEDITDPYYEAKRKNLLVVGYACNEAGDYCFCTSVGLSPFRSDYADILVTDLGEKQVVEILSEKGKIIASELNLSDASEEDISRKRELERKVLSSFVRSVNTENLKERMAQAFNSDYWKEVAMNCVSCGACTYLCPTCFCFDIFDDGELKGVRVRTWDSCQFPLHTLESSSHNPRREKWQRLRNRFYDKFYYMLVRKGEFYCVGCGRCIAACPVGIDIADVISNIPSEVKQ